MLQPKTIKIHLPTRIRKVIAKGRHEFLQTLMVILRERGHNVKIIRRNRINTFRAKHDKNLHLYHVETFDNPRIASFRNVYLPFSWSIETATSRDQYRTASRSFGNGPRPSYCDIYFGRIIARKVDFQHTKHTNLNPDDDIVEGQDFVFIPLQGALSRKRPDQSFSPVDMVQHTIDNSGSKTIILKLHPSAKTSRAERATIKKFCENPRVSMSKANVNILLAKCAYIVTENSAVAFEGMLHQKPSILFAQADFHHICLNIKTRSDIIQAFEKIEVHSPDYARYVHWFTKLNAIRIRENTTKQQIEQALDELGWLKS